MDGRHAQRSRQRASLGLGPGGGQGYRCQLAEVAALEVPFALQWLDYVLLMGEALVSMYEDDPRSGYQLLEQRRAAYDRYMLSRVPARAGLTTRCIKPAV